MKINGYKKINSAGKVKIQIGELYDNNCFIDTINDCYYRFPTKYKDLLEENKTRLYVVHELAIYNDINEKNECRELLKKNPSLIFFNKNYYNNKEWVILVCDYNLRILDYFISISNKYILNYEYLFKRFKFRKETYDLKNNHKIESMLMNDNEYRLYYFVNNIVKLIYIEEFDFIKEYEKELGDEQFIYRVCELLDKKNDIESISHLLDYTKFYDLYDTIEYEEINYNNTSFYNNCEKILKKKPENLSEFENECLLQFIEKTIIYSNNKFELLNLLSDDYLNNRMFLMKCAKRGLCLSIYSEKYMKDYRLAFIEIKYNPDAINQIDINLFNNEKFILSARHLYNDILMYASNRILNDKKFMRDYLIMYSTHINFKLGDLLKEDKNFFVENYKYDTNILFYASDRLLNDSTFMRRMCSVDKSNKRFIGDKLKQDKDFISELALR